VNNFGFPGQYFDEETGLWQNWFRDYDHRTGDGLDPPGTCSWSKYLKLRNKKLNLVEKSDHAKGLKIVLLLGKDWRMVKNV